MRNTILSEMKFHRQSGFTLTEILIALTIICILFTMAAPIYSEAAEQAKLDSAVRNLSIIWSAQRVYWLNNKTYCSDLMTLESLDLLGNKEITLQDTSKSAYLYTIVQADAETFTATATRNESNHWSGVVQITESGSITGGIDGTDSETLLPMAGD